jgi:hypothetical protein
MKELGEENAWALAPDLDTNRTSQHLILCLERAVAHVGSFPAARTGSSFPPYAAALWDDAPVLAALAALLFALDKLLESKMHSSYSFLVCSRGRLAPLMPVIASARRAKPPERVSLSAVRLCGSAAVAGAAGAVRGQLEDQRGAPSG